MTAIDHSDTRSEQRSTEGRIKPTLSQGEQEEEEENEGVRGVPIFGWRELRGDDWRRGNWLIGGDAVIDNCYLAREIFDKLWEPKKKYFKV